MNKLVWTTVQRKVSDLLPFKQNPRRMSEEQMKNLKKSLEEYNLVEIPAIDFDNRILAGHQRLIAMQLIGRGDEVIDCRYPNRKLTEYEAKQYLILSNKVHGEWDEELLVEFFDTDLLIDSGFNQDEINDIFVADLDTEPDNFNTEKELKKIKKPESKLGDLYQLGPHRLYCGDSTKLESVQKAVGDAKIHLIYNDPIYNINLNYKSGIGGTKNYGGSAKDKRSDKDYAEFLKKTIENALAVSHPDTHIFYYCDESYVPMIAGLYAELGIKLNEYKSA